MPKGEKIYCHSVLFANPYKEPPDGKPRRLLEIYSIHHRPTEEQQRQINKLLAEHPKYSQGFDCETISPRMKQKLLLLVRLDLHSIVHP